MFHFRNRLRNNFLTPTLKWSWKKLKGVMQFLVSRSRTARILKISLLAITLVAVTNSPVSAYITVPPDGHPNRNTDPWLIMTHVVIYLIIGSLSDIVNYEF